MYDDNEMIVLNRFIGGWAMLWRAFLNDSWWFRNPLRLPQSAYYRPLQDLWLALNYHLFGPSPPGWHLAMIAIHLAAVWLVFRIAAELTRTRAAPFLAALLFGLIPIHAQAVAWPSAAPLPMSAAFELAALWCFIRRGPGGFQRRIAAPALFALALLSHESAVAFPLIAAAYVFLLGAERGGAPAGARGGGPPLLRGRIAAAARQSAPLWAEAAIYLGVRLLVLGFITRRNQANSLTIAEAILTLPGVLGRYALLLLAPWRAGPAHPVELASSVSSPHFYRPMLALAALAATAVLALRRHPHRRLYLFCAALALVALLPVMDLRALAEQALVEDRYLYLPSAGWCLFVGDAMAGLAMAGVAAETAAVAGAGALAALYAVFLFHAEGFWHDEIALFSRCVESSPRSVLCHGRLGMALKGRGDVAGAERELALAARLDPRDGTNLFNLGILYAETGRLSEAADKLAAALSLLPDAPAEAYVELARVADRAGKPGQADAALSEAARLPGGADAADLGRGEIMMRHRDFAAAEKILRGLVARSPESVRGWAMLGSVRAAGNDLPGAQDAYRRALELDPEDVNLRFLYALTLHRMGRDDEALAECARILEAAPHNRAAQALAARIRRNR